MNLGDYCRASCTAPARYIGEGFCLYISAQDNSLHVDSVAPRYTVNMKLPHPTFREVCAAHSGLMRGIRVRPTAQESKDG